MKHGTNKPTVWQRVNRWIEPLYIVETGSAERLEKRISNLEKRLRSIEAGRHEQPQKP